MNTCKIPDCSNKATRKGLCNAHYMRKYRRKQKSQGTHDEGYELGRYVGRNQVANAVTALLEEHRVICEVHTDTLYLHVPTGTLKANLSEYGD